MAGKLMYSELTGKCYYTDKGKKIEIEEQNFIQMVLLWLHHGLPEETKSVTRTLKVDGVVHYEITCKKMI
jgi:hypothetical protein